ncbi:sigma-70 family RNA polymerase sigma factor [Roseomonas sp. HJA6]|uniref:Sigma-70 family RNA polymerase sigma factor n=1 Tax=Roseomonas alba TaxID=2846776 RepID=A0ABS7A7N2_9PROT|nr:sigma-70 family RNA polymerase sigma factor [Neoroseomonas alba]MBW6398304.1 sigma-70 family RNA polymerase sigma factor [Neoroseomonas alba]
MNSEIDTPEQAVVASDRGPSFHDALVALLPKLRVQALALTRNRADADDLVQAAVTNALAAQASFTPGTNFGAWMYRILRNRFISDRRRLRETVDMDDAPAEAFARPAGQEQNLALGELRTEMARLPADQRTALVMVAVQGMSYEEVAAAMGCAVGTAKCRVFRARRTLEGRLLGEEEQGRATGRRRGAGVAASPPRSMERAARAAAARRQGCDGRA